ncbi:hypothetical protein OAF09_01735 [bacterium]|nr:hypothetical protein [bacterium]
MNKIALLSVIAACISFTNASAESLDQFGLSELKPISTQESNNVRGQGLDSIGMASYQIFIFDYLSGSSLNLQASSINSTNVLHLSGMDGIEMEPVVATDSNALLNGFEFSIDGFTVEASDLTINAIGSAFQFGSTQPVEPENY